MDLSTVHPRPPACTLNQAVDMHLSLEEFPNPNVGRMRMVNALDTIVTLLGLVDFHQLFHSS